MKRITVNVSARGEKKLAEIKAETGLGTTDVIDKALSLYHMVACEGAEMSINDERVRLL